METVERIIGTVNDFVWGVPAMMLIFGVGLYLTVRLRFVQIRHFGYAIKETVGKLFGRKAAKSGAVTPFQALCTALAATVGTGNIAGVAGAIAIGGAGAVFWMWISALFGMATKLVEVTLAVHFREQNGEGDYVGGPMYYIRNGLSRKWHWLAYLFAAFGVAAVFGTGNATQVNTIVSAVDTALEQYFTFSANGRFLLNLMLGMGIAVAVGLVLLGGIGRIGRVTERLVPLMAALYILLAAGVLVIHYRNIPSVLLSIVRGAFRPSAVTGGAIGSVFVTVKKGVSRGIFSNEAGLGTASIAHASAETDHPVSQGLYGIFEVFVDTVVICTLTALVILCTETPISYASPAGAELTIGSFIGTYGEWASVVTAVAMCSFAFSTVLGFGLYGMRCTEFLLGSRANRGFAVIYSAIAVLGATADFGLIWLMAEMFNGLMAIPNLIALALLSPTAIDLIRGYFHRVNEFRGKNSKKCT